MDIHTVQQAKKVIEQLKREKNISRIPVSETIKDLIWYTQEMQKDDYLFNGFPTDKMNPYRPKAAFQCLII